MGINVSTAFSDSGRLIRLDQAVYPQQYKIDLTIDPKSISFGGKVTIDVMLAHAQKRIVLHAGQLAFDTIFVRDKTVIQTPIVNVLANDGTVAIDVVNTVGPGPVTLEFNYRAQLSTGLEGLYKVVDQGSAAVFTQLQAIGARRVFPCFDEPGFKALFDISLRVPKNLVAISNTKEVARSPLADGFVLHQFATTKPLPTYLIAIAVGDFDVVNAKAIPATPLRDHSIPLRGIAMRGSGEDLSIALDYTAKLVMEEEKYFGIAYPFDKLDIIAVPDFGAGGMENAGAITYDESLVLLGDDATLQRRREFLTTHAHEIAHHWFGNFASLQWWDDLWLNESFASFMESKFAAQVEPGWHYDADTLVNAHEAMILDRASSVRRVREPVDQLDGISAAFDAITYQKGAALLAMVENTMGAEPFRQFVHDFLAEHAYGTMNTNDFLAALSKYPSGDVAAHMLSTYINKQGAPLVTLVDNSIGAQLSQSRFGRSPALGNWSIPVCISQINGNISECHNFETSQVQIKPVKDILKNAIVPIDEVARYYLFDVPSKSWSEILNAVSTMPRAKALAVAINLDLAFIDGRVSLDLYNHGVNEITKHPDWEVAGFPLTRMNQLAAEKGQCPSVAEQMKSRIKALYVPMLNRIGLQSQLDGTDIKTWLLELQREHLVDELASSSADPKLFEKLARLGRALAKDPEEQLDDSEIAPADVVGAALVAAASQGGVTFLELAIARFKNTDDLHERTLWLHAIASSQASEASSSIEQLLLSSDLRNQEVPDLLFARAAQPAFRTATWDIVERNSAALLARLNGDLELSLIQVAEGFASEELAKRVESTIAPLIGKLRGGSVQLQQTLEKIRDNEALLKHLEDAALCQIAQK